MFNVGDFINNFKDSTSFDGIMKFFKHYLQSRLSKMMQHDVFPSIAMSSS